MIAGSYTTYYIVLNELKGYKWALPAKALNLFLFLEVLLLLRIRILDKSGIALFTASRLSPKQLRGNSKYAD